MAAPTNFGQIQQQVAMAIWFMDLVDGPKTRGILLRQIKDELDAVEKGKAELEVGQSFKNALGRIKTDTEKARKDLEAARGKVADAAREAEDIKAAAHGAVTKLEEQRATLDTVREDLRQQAAGLNRRGEDLDALGTGLDGKAADLTSLRVELDKRSDKLNQEAERLRGVKAQLEAVRGVKI